MSENDVVEEGTVLDPDPGRQAAFEEMQAAWKRQYETLDILKETAKTMLGYTSVFLGLIGVLQISGFFALPSITYKALGAVCAAAYIVLVCLCLGVMSPAGMFGPILAEWNTLALYMFNKENNELLNRRIYDYVEAIEMNNQVLKKKALQVKWAGVLFPLIIVLLFLMGLFA